MGHRQAWNYQDLTGKRFGKWIVLHRAENIGMGNNARATFLCKCDCGMEYVVRATDLKLGKSTGCMKCGGRKDLTGQRFGRWLVLGRAENNKKQPAWFCRCDCGTEKKVQATGLISGRSKSCGCLHREVSGEMARKMRGPLHPNWNPNLTAEERSDERKSTEYRLWRLGVYERDEFTCQACGQGGGRLEAHHLANHAEHKELRLDLDNGVTLCRKCHAAYHLKHGRKSNNPEQFFKWAKMPIEMEV